VGEEYENRHRGRIEQHAPFFPTSGKTWSTLTSKGSWPVREFHSLRSRSTISCMPATWAATLSRASFWSRMSVASWSGVTCLLSEREKRGRAQVRM